MSDLTLPEMENAVKVNKIYDNAAVLSNILELTTNIMIKASMDNIADSLNNQSLTREVIANVVANRLKNKFLKGR